MNYSGSSSICLGELLAIFMALRGFSCRIFFATNIVEHGTTPKCCCFMVQAGAKHLKHGFQSLCVQHCSAMRLQVGREIAQASQNGQPRFDGRVTRALQLMHQPVRCMKSVKLLR
eukprot:TRINITY_DN12249_c0_g3_i10.p6 TRINITY_DN12249_c0_g3~~TRINITY_DN12249_c0_g3_i10.p6  ORF type:complete len:115 (-),score=14.40 TRINITY_DN12249_c0_g3_i10:2286-2630(-)